MKNGEAIIAVAIVLTFVGISVVALLHGVTDGGVKALLQEEQCEELSTGCEEERTKR